MAVHCDNCGTEILAGHRFCRSCGRATDDFAEEGTPTQMMPPENQVRGARDTAAASPSRPDTSPVYAPQQQQNYYQQPYAPIQPPHQMPHYTPQRSRSPWGWIVAVIAIFLIGAFAIGLFVFADRPGGRADQPLPAEPGPPPPPPPPPGGQTFGSGTTVTRTFPLASGARFDLTTIQGEIRIVGWDQQQAQVKVTKSESTEVRVVPGSNSLSLATEPRGGSLKADYEISLPRDIGRVQLKLAMSDVELSDINGEIVIETGTGSVTLSDINGKVQVNAGTGDVGLSDVRGEISINAGTGSIELNDISGSVKANSGNGDISVAFAGESREPVALNTADGDIEIKFDSDVNADIEARTVTGDININGDFGIGVKEDRGGKTVAGRIGSGGQRITATTRSGDVRITK